MKKIYVLLLLAAVGIGQVYAETLTIRIENAEIGRGPIRVGIYNDDKAFPDPDKYYASADTEAADTVVIVTMPLPKGTYVVAVYQDKNNNGKLDKFMGIPKEKYGFSNNTMVPNWGKNSFEMNGDTSVTIRLR